MRAEAPAPAALAAYGVGQSYVRLFQDSIMPGTCGIVLEREQCGADFHAVQGWRGSDPTDASIAKWLADGDVASHTSDWNGSSVTDKAWQDDPTFAWWYTAGAISIAVDQPRSQVTSDYLAHYVGELTRHPAAAPASFAGLIAPGESPYDRTRPLRRALDAAVPMVSYPVVSLGTGATATARLGVYVATLLELVDNPLALSRPQSRAFAAALLAELEGRHREYADGLSLASLQAILQADIPTDPRALDASWRRPLSSQTLNMKWPQAQRYALVFGQLVAQTAYNAAVPKDSAADASFRAALAHITWPGMSDRLRSDVAALAKVPSASGGGSWTAINQAATRATLDLTSAAAQ